MAKIAQDRPEEPPNRLAKIPKCSQNVVVLFVFTLLPFLQRSLPRPVKIDKTALQVASGRPSRAQLGPSWRHLGSNLGPSCVIWPRSWTIRGYPKSAKAASKRIFMPRSLPRPPRPPPDLDFHSFWDPFLIHVRILFKSFIERFGV